LVSKFSTVCGKKMFYWIDYIFTMLSTCFWLATIPIYCLSLFFVFLFYNKGHVWKKEGVSVGYKYDCTDDVKRKKWQRKFHGIWVSSSIKKESTDESNKILLILIIMMTVIFITILSIVVLGGTNLTLNF
jgi:hypothetical protein